MQVESMLFRQLCRNAERIGVYIPCCTDSYVFSAINVQPDYFFHDSIVYRCFSPSYFYAQTNKVVMGLAVGLFVIAFVFAVVYFFRDKGK